MSWYPKAIIAVLLAWLATPGTVTAQLSRPQFGVAAGATFPQGDFTTGLSGFKPGWEGMAFLASRIGHSPVGFRLDGSYGANSSSEPVNGVPEDNRLGLLGWDADLTVTFVSRFPPARTKVYLLVGPGLYRLYSTSTYGNGPSSSTYSSVDTKFAYNLGGGFTVGALFFEVRYVHIDGFGNERSDIFVPITAGIRFGSR